MARAPRATRGARGRGRGGTRGRSISQPGRGVRATQVTPMRRRRQGRAQLQVALLENVNGIAQPLARLRLEPGPPEEQDMQVTSPQSTASDDWEWEEEQSSQRDQSQGEPSVVEVNKAVERENISLADRIAPEVPVPIEVHEEDSDGWSLIERVGGWDSFLCEFQVLEEVPAQHKGTWVWAWATVLERMLAEDSGRGLDRALMWLCFLPQALLMQAKRGGRSGRKLVAQRFNSLVGGDWGNLFKPWE